MAHLLEFCCLFCEIFDTGIIIIYYLGFVIQCIVSCALKSLSPSVFITTFFIALCSSVLSSAFLTIEIRACFDTGDLGSPLGVLPYILWDIRHRHSHQLITTWAWGLKYTAWSLALRGLFLQAFSISLQPWTRIQPSHSSALCGSVLSSAFLTIEIRVCFNTGDLGSPFGVLLSILWDIRHRHNHHLLPGVCNTMHSLLRSEVPFAKRFHYNLLYCSMQFSTVVCFSDNWNKSLFRYRRSWLTFRSFATHFVRYSTQA